MLDTPFRLVVTRYKPKTQTRKDKFESAMTVPVLRLKQERQSLHL